jgi:hypothetical protein
MDIFVALFLSKKAKIPIELKNSIESQADKLQMKRARTKETIN